MPLYTKTNFVAIDRTVPTAEDIAAGIPINPVLADHLLYAISKGYTTANVQLTTGTSETGDPEFSILREWTDPDQAQIWAEITEGVMSDSVSNSGFVSVEVITL